jgi:hypothetical protein
MLAEAGVNDELRIRFISNAVRCWFSFVISFVSAQVNDEL